MRNISIYGHSGSFNHGNEAIVRGICKIFNDDDITLYSFDPSIDIKYDLDKVCRVVATGIKPKKYSLHNAIYKIVRIITQKQHFSYKTRFKYLLENVNAGGIYILEAGDQYCESDIVRNFYAYINKVINNKGGKTVAYGCTINPEILSDSKVIDDLNNYSLIIARESITYNALLESDVTTKVKLMPCPSFVMDSYEHELPIIFEKGDVVGINAGPLAQGNEVHYDLLYKNYITLIDYIINDTNFNIALIPHVNWGSKFSDLSTLEPLYLKYKSTNRIILVSEQNAMKQKYVMSKCRFMVALRTHVSVPSYAACVPTLVTGYKVKSRGIANEIFGTSDNYVVPVQLLKKEDEIKNAFVWFQENEENIKNHLNQTMPNYIDSAYKSKQEIEKILKELKLN